MADKPEGLVETEPAKSSASGGLEAIAQSNFEKLIATLLEYMGYRVETKKANADGSLDIKAVTSTKKLHLIQVKRLPATVPMDAPALREFYRVLTADGSCTKGLIICTSGFSPQALQFAKEIEGSQGKPLELIGRKKLLSLLEQNGLMGEVPEATEEKVYKYIRWDDSGTTAHMTLCRPKQNIMNMEMMKEMAYAIQTLNNRDDVRLILLDSAPECEGYFSAGVGAEGYTTQMVFQMLDAFHHVFRSMIEISKPVLAVVDGIASAGGCELAAFCDLVIATENARFLQPEIKLGVFPPLGAVVYPRVIGPKRAMELLLTGDTLNAQQALQIGLVNRVVPRSALKETVDALVKRLSEQSGPVLALLKRVIFEGTWLPFNDALKKSQDIYLNQLFELEDSQEGLRALVERRKPVWKNK